MPQPRTARNACKDTRNCTGDKIENCRQHNNSTIVADAAQVQDMAGASNDRAPPAAFETEGPTRYGYRTTPKVILFLPQVVSFQLGRI